MHISPPPFHFIRIQWGLYFFILHDILSTLIYSFYIINLYFPSVYLNTHVRIINQRRNLSYTFSLHQLYFFHYFLTQFNNSAVVTITVITSKLFSIAVINFHVMTFVVIVTILVVIIFFIISIWFYTSCRKNSCNIT